MRVETFPISGLKLIEPTVFGDERGYFFETYSAKCYHDAGLSADFIQDNESLSQVGVLRGLHFQKPPHSQAKLVRVISGSVWDVALDLRRSSPTYGQSQGVLLSSENKRQFYIPQGFAHGFYCLEEAVFSYKCSALYCKEAEMSLLWNDPSLKIEWPSSSQPLLSEKDLQAPLFENFISPFE